MTGINIVSLLDTPDYKLKVGDIFQTCLQPKNLWKVIKYENEIYTYQSLISGRFVEDDQTGVIMLSVYDDGIREYNFENNRTEMMSESMKSLYIKKEDRKK